jgi:hypothetical protein
MSAATTMPPTFSGEELTQLLALIKDSDSVELKLTVPETDQRSAVASLGLDPLEAQIRQIFFFDTPDLALDKQGVVVRARRIQGKGDDSAVKLRPVVPAELPDDLRRSAAFRVEVDALPGGYVCSGALKGALRPTDVARAVAGELPLRKLFSKEQRAFFAAHVEGDIGFDDLAILGPIFVLKLKLAPPGLGRRLVAEMWLYPDGSRVLELSARAEIGEAFQVAAELRSFLTANGIDLSGEQETKTRKALTYFSKLKRKAPSARASARSSGAGAELGEATRQKHG